MVLVPIQTTNSLGASSILRPSIVDLRPVLRVRDFTHLIPGIPSIPLLGRLLLIHALIRALISIVSCCCSRKRWSAKCFAIGLQHGIGLFHTAVGQELHDAVVRFLGLLDQEVHHIPRVITPRGGLIFTQFILQSTTGSYLVVLLHCLVGLLSCSPTR